MKNKNKIKNNKKIDKLSGLRAKISELLNDKYHKIVTEEKDTTHKIFIHVGPTNSGKTYSSLLDLEKAERGVYLGPLRLLAWEVFDKMTQAGTPCTLLTGEEQRIVDGSKVDACTVEMFNPTKEYDVAVIDECQLLADEARGYAWTKAILYIKAKVLHLICAPYALPIIEKLLKRTKRKYEIINHERFLPLKVCSKPDNPGQPQEKTIFVTFSRMEALSLKNELEHKYNMPTSIIYGNLPPEVKQKQAENFLNGVTKVMVATDAIGLGLNLPAERVCFTAISKFDGIEQRPLHAHEVQQIAGRAGRYGLAKEGEISAWGKTELNFIAGKLAEIPPYIKKAQIAPEVADLKTLGRPVLFDALSTWKNVSAVPDNLKDIVVMSNLDEQIELAKQLHFSGLDKSFTFEECYELVKCPTTKETRAYWINCVKAIYNNEYIPKPRKGYIISSERDLSDTENAVKEHDIYLWFSYRKQYSYYTEKREEILKAKAKLSKTLDDFLMKKAQIHKICRSCDKKLHLNYAHKICQECFESNY